MEQLEILKENVKKHKKAIIIGGIVVAGIAIGAVVAVALANAQQTVDVDEFDELSVDLSNEPMLSE